MANTIDEALPGCPAQPDGDHVGDQKAAAPAEALQGTSGKYTKPESLIAAAEAGGTKLLSGRWLVDFDRKRGKDEPIKRNQDLPDEAFVDPAQMRAKGLCQPADCYGKYVVVAVSYCWLTPTHPDPKGQQLATLAQALVLLLTDGFYAQCADVAVFLDFGSLPQAPRDTPEEGAAFKRGLKDVNLWYAHALTWVFLLTKFPAGWPEVKPYYERGWPAFEHRIATLVKDAAMCLDLAFLASSFYADFGDLVRGCKFGRPVPQGPDAFAEHVGNLHFTNGADTAFVQAKYRQTAVEVLSDVEALSFHHLGWGPEEAAELAQVLPLAGRLKVLNLSGNRFGPGGVAALGQALSDCLTLEELNVGGNDIGDEGATGLAAALLGCRAFRILDLSKTALTDAGVAALAQALSPCAGLEALYLHDNQIGNEGAASLAAALSGWRAIKDLRLSTNRIGNAGAQALARALPGCPAMRNLNLRDNEVGWSGCQALNKAKAPVHGRGSVNVILDSQRDTGCCALQ